MEPLKIMTMVFYLIERRNRQVIKKRSDMILPIQKV